MEASIGDVMECKLDQIKVLKHDMKKIKKKLRFSVFCWKFQKNYEINNSQKLEKK